MLNFDAALGTDMIHSIRHAKVRVIFGELDHCSATSA
jgi:hypothetical protein